jgi:hypothetical protein
LAKERPVQVKIEDIGYQKPVHLLNLRRHSVELLDMSGQLFLPYTRYFGRSGRIECTSTHWSIDNHMETDKMLKYRWMTYLRQSRNLVPRGIWRLNPCFVG